MLLVLWVVYLILVINFSFSTLNHSYERRASSSGVTTPGENASLQVRRRGVRRRNLCPGFGLPVAGSPGTPFFSFFPFFSYLFFSFLAVENGEIQSSCGVGERLSREQLRRRSPSSRSSCLFFFFFYFGHGKWRNPEQLRCRGETELLRRRSQIVGEEEDHPTQNDVVLGWCDFF